LLLGPAGLEATHPSEARRLGELVRAALRTTNGNGFHPAGAMHIHRARSDRPLTLLVSPFRGQGMPIFLSRPAVAVFIADPDQQGQAREQVMQELYGLTPAETELALLLAAGKSLKEAAAERSVSLETARSQLKTLFSKTNTRRQSELVRLVLLLPGEPNP
jgi:DNA-binding CsgD family transcriptional regulator